MNPSPDLLNASWAVCMLDICTLACSRPQPSSGRAAHRGVGFRQTQQSCWAMFAASGSSCWQRLCSESAACWWRSKTWSCGSTPLACRSVHTACCLLFGFASARCWLGSLSWHLGERVDHCLLCVVDRSGQHVACWGAAPSVGSWSFCFTATVWACG